MDEYNLAEVFLNHEGIQTEEVDINKYQKIPFAELAGFGGMIAELIPQFRTVTQTIEIPMEGLFRAINPKTGEIMTDLMYQSRQVNGAYVGAMMQPNGAFDQAAFEKVFSVKQVSNTVAAINPATLFIAAGIMAMSKKLSAIEETQENIMGFLEKDKVAQMKGNLAFLMSVYDEYRSNWDKETFKSAQYIKTQDIKQESEQKIALYRMQLNDELQKKKGLASKLSIKKDMRKLVEEFSDYRLAIYLYAFASYLEIILLENYKAEYLSTLSSKIQDESINYVELYTIAYNKLEDMANSSIESGAIKGAARVSQGLGKVIEKIPVVERGQLDENLIAAGKKLEEYKDDSVDELLYELRTINNCQVKQFIDLIDAVNEMHNGESAILVDGENVYVAMAV